MAETLGILCDKLTIVKLKQYHSDEEQKLESLNKQASQLQEEIDEFILKAVYGIIPPEKLTFVANKVFKIGGNESVEVFGNIGELFFQLAEINCRLWHEVEKGYDIENVPVDEKNNIVKMLAVLNLQRNNCIDAIDRKLFELIMNKK